MSTRSAATAFPAYIDSVMAARNTKDNHGLGNEVSLPYQREKLVFDGGWGVLRAGWGMLVTEPAPSDPSTVNFIGKVFSNSFVSAFYKVRDYVQAHCDASNLYPLFFEQHISEGRYTDQRWTIFDHRNHTVYYKSNKGEFSRTVQPGIQSYHSLLFYVRTRELAVGDTFNIRCFYQWRDYPILFTVLGRETVSVPAGRFDCFKLAPRLVGEGRGLTRKDQITIWLTTDRYRMPVLVKAKFSIGQVSARLLYYERE